MIHPHTELRFISPEKGYGVVATQFIPRGTITWVFDALDRTFTEDEVHNMSAVYQDILLKYCYRDPQGIFVLCWDHSRYVNHSYVSNCISTAYNFEVAVRDIEPGEELTDDYGYLNLWEPFYAPQERGSERKAVYPDDLLHFSEEWDQQLLRAFRRFNFVEQPLAKMLDEQTLELAKQIGAGKAKMKSIRSCYYEGALKQPFEEAPLPGTL